MLSTNIVFPTTLFTETSTPGRIAELRNLHDQLTDATRTVERMLTCFETIEDSEHAKANLEKIQDQFLEAQRHFVR